MWIPLQVFYIQPDNFSKKLDPFINICSGLQFVNPQRFCDDIVHGHARVKGRIRILKNHLDIFTEAFQRLSAEIEQRYGRAVKLQVGVVASSGRYEGKVSQVEEFLASPESDIGNIEVQPVETRIYHCETQPMEEGYATLEGFAIDTRDAGLYRYAPQRHEIGTHPSNVKLSTHTEQ